MGKAVLFDDINVGDQFETDTYLMDEDSTIKFASQFDPQPMHLDHTAAESGPFGELTASGWHTLALTMRLMALRQPLGETPLLGVGVDAVSFKKPVLPGTQIVVHATVVNKRRSSKPGRGFVKMHVKTIDAANQDLLVQQTWNVLVPSKS